MTDIPTHLVPFVRQAVAEPGDGGRAVALVRRRAVRVAAAALRRLDQLLATIGARSRVEVVPRPGRAQQRLSPKTHHSIVGVRERVFLILREGLSLEVGISENAF